MKVYEREFDRMYNLKSFKTKPFSAIQEQFPVPSSCAVELCWLEILLFRFLFNGLDLPSSSTASSDEGQSENGLLHVSRRVSRLFADGPALSVPLR